MLHRFALLLLILTALPAAAETIYGQVVGISDGDTIKILDDDRQLHRIRFREIDAPEKDQPFGQASKQSMSDLVYGKDVRAECDGWHRERRLCFVFVGQINVGTEQVARGLAWVYRQYAPKLSPLYALETEARLSKRGLWRDSSPIPPWEWRHGPVKN